jgi:uncharacterized protein with FMN-binding domain
LRRTGIVITATMLAMLALLATKAGAKSNEVATVVRSGESTTVTGPQIVLAHGIVQVRVTITDGRITDVTALQLPHDNPDSWNTSNRAAPILRSEVLAMQSANVNVVSGATYTSRGYARSLQAALDAANNTA